MTRTLRTWHVLVTVGAAAMLAACGSPGAPDSPTTVSPPAATTAGPTTGGAASGGTTSGDTAAAVADQDRCTTQELSVNEGRVEGSAGSVTIPLVFTNTGSRTCTLYGFPGVSYVDGADGVEIGAAATRAGGSGEPVVLAPGGRATATVRAVQVLNYPAEQCNPTPVAGLRVYPPNDTATLFVSRAGTGCAQHGVDQLEVTAVDGR
ncbi:DUF4232 domain-containing protein [Rhodococcus sp. NPDC003348]